MESIMSISLRTTTTNKSIVILAFLSCMSASMPTMMKADTGVAQVEGVMNSSPEGLAINLLKMYAIAKLIYSRLQEEGEKSESEKASRYSEWGRAALLGVSLEIMNWVRIKGLNPTSRAGMENEASLSRLINKVFTTFLGGDMIVRIMRADNVFDAATCVGVNTLFLVPFLAGNPFDHLQS